jgi:hypothetical protein
VTALELVIVDVLGWGWGLGLGLGLGGGDLRSGIAAFAPTDVIATLCAPWTLVAGAS